jgi:rare lipoprotein A
MIGGAMRCNFFITALMVTMLATFSGCARKPVMPAYETAGSYTIMGKTYFPMKRVQSGHSEDGTASWYGPGFHGKKTANGETYDMHELTAAHNVLPLNTLVRVKNLANDREVTLRINDRGPFAGERVIDLSYAAAQELGIVQPGTAPVRITVLEGAETKTARTIAAPKPKVFARSANPYYSGSSLLPRLFSRAEPVK